MRRWGFAAVALAVVLIGLLVSNRHAVIGYVLPRAIGLATGYDVTIGTFRLGTTHGALLHVHVSKGGEPVLAARRVDLWYNVRDLLPGSRHRYGVNEIAIDAPSLTLVRHKDGSYNVALPHAEAPAPTIPTPINRVPIALTVRIRNGSGALRAPYALDPQSRNLAVRDVSLDASIDTAARTRYQLHGAFVESKLEPFGAKGTIDVVRGFAMHHAYAAAIPMRAIGNYFINSDAARILGGTAHGFDIRAYALDVQPFEPIAYHLSGRLDVSDGQLHIVGLAPPLAHIAGRLQLVDDAFFFDRLSASLADVPVAVSGGIIDFADPQYRLGIAARGDLRRLRALFAFSQAEPVAGNAEVRALVEGPLDDPVITAQLDAERARYDRVALERVHAAIAYHDSTVFIAPLQADGAGAQIALRGTLEIGDQVRTRAALHLAGPADRLPYAGELLGREPLLVDVMLDGRDTTFRAYGALAAASGVRRAAAVVHLEPSGLVDVAPFHVQSARGSLDGGYHLNRATDESAFWLQGEGVALTAPPRASFLGEELPQLPAIAGTVDRVALVGGGKSGTHALVAGSLQAHDTTVAGVRFDRLQARFAGTLAGAAVSPVLASGPWGTLAGSGVLSTNALAVRGAYRGTLAGLRPYFADAPATGTLDGTAALAIAPDRITIQADDLHLHGASVRGIPIERVRGTLAVEGGVVHVLSADAGVAGGSVVAAGSYAKGIAVVATGLAGAQLHGLGLPLDGGRVDASGTVAEGAPLPRFDGGITLAGGRVQANAVAGSGLVSVRGDGARLSHVVGALDGIYARASGDLSGLTTGDPGYAVRADVPAGDVTRALHALQLPTLASDGTFNAQLDVRGHGLEPFVRGPIAVPAGSINGLPFLDGRAVISADRSGVIARGGSVVVGSTRLAFAAGDRPHISGVRVRAAHTDLSDFNNYFDTGDTLDGAGSMRFDLISQLHRISSNGDVNIRGFRYRNLAIGDTRASWSSSRNVLKGSLAVSGAQGSLRTHGSIGFAPSPLWQRVVRDSRYDLALDFDDVDVPTWLAALGFPQIPITGRADADATVAGRYPRLRLQGSASLNQGSIWRLPLESFELAFSSSDLGRVKLDRGTLVAPGITANGSGDFGLSPNDPVHLSVYANTDDLPKLVAQLAHVRIPVTGTFESTATVSGSFAKPVFAAAFDATDATVDGVAIPLLYGSLQLQNSSIELRNAGVEFTRGQMTLAGSLPLQLQPFGIGPVKAPVSLDLALKGLDPSDFAVLLGNHTQLGGSIDGQLGVSGTIGEPRIYGRFGIARGSYQSDLEHMPITGITADLSFDRTQARVNRLFARLGAGTLDASGSVHFPNGFTNVNAGGGASFSVDALARGAQLDLPAYGSGTIDAKLALTRTSGSTAVLSGNATLSNAVIPFAAFLGAAQGGPTPGTLPVALGFDLGLAAGKNVRVRGGGYGAGLDIGATGSVKLAGTLASPTLDGGFTATSGTLTYFDRAFRVQQGTVTFVPADGIIPTLHASGVTHVVNADTNLARNPYGSADITIDVDGPLNGLKIAFSSNPAGYTNEQILAMIAPFGGLISGASYAPSLNGTTSNQLGALSVVPGAQLGQTSGSSSLNLGQEAFNILNAQFTAGLLSPFENALSEGLGFQNVNVTVDFYGNVGFSAQRLLGKTVSFIYSQTFGVPERTSFGLQLLGSRATNAQLNFYVVNGPQRLFETPVAGISASGRTVIGEPIQGSSGFSFTLQRLFW
ncbi:MAG: translocation/assembly module TamB domain-containing protein [bacterium]|nr:translocation/assembly module TamB domain-containing protein [bacterium]